MLGLTHSLNRRFICVREGCIQIWLCVDSLLSILKSDYTWMSWEIEAFIDPGEIAYFKFRVLMPSAFSAKAIDVTHYKKEY